MQLTSVKTDETSNLLWAMELPLKNQDSTSIFDIRIQQEQQGHEQEQANHRWSLSIAFELEGLGPIYVKATLFNEKVSATFWLNEPETHKLFHEHLQTLQKRLQDAGLDIEQINLTRGKPEINTRSSWQRIVDEKV
jgi:hypothetical protein